MTIHTIHLESIIINHNLNNICRTKQKPDCPFKKMSYTSIHIPLHIPPEKDDQRSLKDFPEKDWNKMTLIHNFISHQCFLRETGGDV